jgi:hypothetical protein
MGTSISGKTNSARARVRIGQWDRRVRDALRLTVRDLFERPVFKPEEAPRIADLHPPPADVRQHAVLGSLDLLTSGRSGWQGSLQRVWIHSEQYRRYQGLT